VPHPKWVAEEGPSRFDSSIESNHGAVFALIASAVAYRQQLRG